MKIFGPVLAVLVLGAILCGTSAPLHAADVKAPLYLVLFRMGVVENGKLQHFQLVKVIDLLSGSNNPASVALPPEFFDDARKKIEAERFKPTLEDGKPSTTLTSFIYAPAEEKSEPPGYSFSALNGALCNVNEFQLLGKQAAGSMFVANLGRSSFSVRYYALDLPKARKDQREAIVEAELKRSNANIPNAEILSRKNLSTDSQTIMEYTCKTSSNRALTIRVRFICNDRQTLACSIIMPDGLPAEELQAFDRLFEAFRFR